MSMLQRLGGWFATRLGFSTLKQVLKHPVPPETASGKTAWLYIFGNATLVVFINQVVTGAILATLYVPAPAYAYESLLYITDVVTLGRMLRGMHFFGASAMVILISLHMTRVFLTASYKFPREMNWLSGVLLLVLTLAMAFTGQLLRWDQNGIWTVHVAAYIAGQVPFIGTELGEFIMAGDAVGGTTLTRFFALHVFIMPVLIFLIVALHLYLVLHHGVSELPKSGQAVDPHTYCERYERMLKQRGRPYWPDVTWREITLGVTTLAIIALLAFLFGPRGPEEPPNPADLTVNPQPDWFFLWYYAVLAYHPRGLGELVMVYIPLAILIILILLPLVFSRGERSPLRRPWAPAIVVLTAISIIFLTVAGFRAPWVLIFEAEPLPPAVVDTTDDVVQQGAQLVYSEGCLSCHTVAGVGGEFGPPLDEVAGRLPPQEITLRIMNGLGDMPAYRNMLTLEELNAIVTFIESLEDDPIDRLEAVED